MANKEIKFMALIIPRKDLNGFFEKHPEVEPLIENIGKAYAEYRMTTGRKPFNQYVIVNQDEPYIDKVWQSISNGEDKKEKKANKNE